MNDDRLTHFPRVLCGAGESAYGGSQDWFRNPWYRLSGCAAVSATNLAAFYRIGMEPDAGENAAQDASAAQDGQRADFFSQDVYRDHMKAMFRDHMTSGMMGFPDPEKYCSEFAAYAREHGFAVRPHKQYERASAEEAVTWICERLALDAPVVILILNHEEDALDDIRWHWMTITGYDGDRAEIIVSNYGRKERYAAQAVFAAGEKNQVYLISFDIFSAAESVRAEEGSFPEI